MNDPDVDRTEAIRQIATILAAAYLRLRSPLPRNLTPQRRRASMGLLVNTMRTEEKMDETGIREQIESLRHLTVGQLKGKVPGGLRRGEPRRAEGFGQPPPSGHRPDRPP